MAINYAGKGATGGDNPNEALTKMLANLQKFAGPIFETAVKQGGWGATTTTTTPGDPIAAGKLMIDAVGSGAELQGKAADRRMKAISEAHGINAAAAETKAKALADIPSIGETLLGAVQGYLSGRQAGEAAGFSIGGEGGQSVGAAIGGAIGAAAMGSGSIKTMASSGQMLNNIATQAAVWEKSTRVKMSQEAVASMSQRMGELNNPRTTQEAVKFANEKAKLVNETAQSLVLAGVAPDKALQASQQMAAIYDPQGQFSDSRTQFAAAYAEYLAIPNPKKQDKDLLKQKINTIVAGENIRQGKLPVNINTALFGGSQGIPAAGPVNNPGAGPVGAGAPQQPGMAGRPIEIEQIDGNGNPIGLPFSSGGGPVAGSVPPTGGGASGSWAPPNGGASGSWSTTTPPPQAEIDPNFLSKDSQLGHNQASTAISIIDQMTSIMDTGDLPTGTLEGTAWNIFDEGVSGSAASGMGAIAGGIAGGIAAGVPSMGVGMAAGVAGGAVTGGTMGKGMTGLGVGVQLPGLSDEEVENMQSMSVLSQALQTAISKATDPKTGVQRYEGIAWQNLIFNPRKSLAANKKSLETLRDLMAEADAKFAAEAARNQAAGRIGGVAAKSSRVAAPKPISGVYLFE